MVNYALSIVLQRLEQTNISHEEAHVKSFISRYVQSTYPDCSAAVPDYGQTTDNIHTVWLYQTGNNILIAVKRPRLLHSEQLQLFLDSSDTR